MTGKNLDDITTEMMEYVCDSLCKYPGMESDEEFLAELCDGCRMGKFVCFILNQGIRRSDKGRFEIRGR